jgi:hypothetical protein
VALGEVADFITAVSAANIPYVSASVNAAGNIVFTHSQGGTIFLSNAVGTPINSCRIYYIYRQSTSESSQLSLFGAE